MSVRTKSSSEKVDGSPLPELHPDDPPSVLRELAHARAAWFSGNHAETLSSLHAAAKAASQSAPPRRATELNAAATSFAKNLDAQSGTRRSTGLMPAFTGERSVERTKAKSSPAPPASEEPANFDTTITAKVRGV